MSSTMNHRIFGRPSAADEERTEMNAHRANKTERKIFME
jgi:hypothetical protein